VNSIELCQHVKGMKVANALMVIATAGRTSRYTYLNGKNLIENVTKDYDENRLNLRVERDMIKHARVG
jgi:hypothetical protein